MIWKDLIRKGLQSANQYLKRNQIFKEKVHQPPSPAKMASAKKKVKLIPEESEVIIDINHKGECTFKVISKVESFSEDIDKLDSKNDSGLLETKSEKKDVEASRMNGKASKTVKHAGDCAVDPSSPRRSAFDNASDGRDDNCSRYPPTSAFVALDCEFVGVLNDQSALGRCSIVDYDGNVLCDIYARPLENITTYRTRWSGITKKDMIKAIPLESALSQISEIIKDKILVGHALCNDFRVLGFTHPPDKIRDTSKSPPLISLMRKAGVKQSALKHYAWTLLGKKIQVGEHCSVTDARTSMELYKLVRKEWEELYINSIGDDKDEPLDSVQKFTSNIEDNSKNSTNANGIINKMISIANMNGYENCVTKLGRSSQNWKKGRKRKIEHTSSGMENWNNCGIESSLNGGSFQTLCQATKKTYQKFHKALSKQKRKPRAVHKSAMALHYAENVKSLFEDKFWENEDGIQSDMCESL